MKLITNTFLFVFIALFSRNMNAQTQLIPFLKGNKWGYSDLQGKLIVPADYDTVEYYPTIGHIAFKVTLNGKIGAVDASGKLLCPVQYDEITQYFMGFFTFRIGQKFIVTKKPFQKQQQEYDALKKIKLEDYDHFSYIITSKKGKKGFLIQKFEDTSIYELKPIYDSLSLIPNQDGTHTISTWLAGKNQMNVIPKSYTADERSWLKADDESEYFVPAYESDKPERKNKILIKDSCGLKQIHGDYANRFGEIRHLKSNWYDQVIQISEDDPLYITASYGKWGIYDNKTNTEPIPPYYDTMSYVLNHSIAINHDNYLYNLPIFLAKKVDSIHVCTVDHKRSKLELFRYHVREPVDVVSTSNQFILCLHQGDSGVIYSSVPNLGLKIDHCPDKILKHINTFHMTNYKCDILLVEHQGKQFYMDLLSGRWYYSPE